MSILSVTSPELANLLTTHELDLIDVREAHEWETGHIPGARLVPLAEFRADPEKYLQRKATVFICAKGVRSMAAAKLADRFGYDSLYNLEGGTKAWAALGLPVTLPAARVAA
jgi:rhodanese-related sulfurtransferase